MARIEGTDCEGMDAEGVSGRSRESSNRPLHRFDSSTAFDQRSMVVAVQPT